MREIRGMLLGLHRTNSRVSLHSLTSFAGSINTKKAYKEVFQSLYRVGVTGEVLKQKKREILKIFGAQDSSIQIDDNTIEDQNQFPIEDDLEENILHTAAYGGYDDTVQPLHMRSDSIEATDKDIESSLHTTPLHTTLLRSAVQDGDTDMVKCLLENGTSIEAIDEDNNTPLHLAAWNGHTGVVELLLGKGALIEALNKNKDTPLHLAAQSGHTGVVELLLGKGALIEVQNNYQNTPLYLATWSGHTGVVELLIEKYNSLASAKSGQIVKKVQFGTEDIADRKSVV